MEIWWNSLDLFLQIMWGIALVTSIIFVVQMIMTFAGMDADGNLEDGGSDGDAPFQLFTFRNFINFFLGFSWTGIVFYPSIESTVWLTLLSTFMGILLVALVMLLFYALSRMVQSGNIDIRYATGLTAIVYIPIAARRARAGKVQVNIRQAIREYDAMTDGDEIATGRLVRIKEVIDGNVLLVEELQ